jgi:hypothetical protein
MSTYYGFPGFIESNGEFTSCIVGYPMNKLKTELNLSSPVYAIVVSGGSGDDDSAVDFSIANSMDLFPKMCAQRRMENRPVTLFAGPGLIRTAGTLNSWMDRVHAVPGAFKKLLGALPVFKYDADKGSDSGTFELVRGFDAKIFDEIDRVVPFSIVPRNMMSSTTLFSPDSFPLVKFERSHVRMAEVSDEELAALRSKKRRLE